MNAVVRLEPPITPRPDQQAAPGAVLAALASSLSPPRFKLRAYQAEAEAKACAALERGRSVVLVLPTGGGKGVILARLAGEWAAAGKRVVVAAHRVEICDQLAANLTELGIAHGRIAPGSLITSHLVQVAMIQTLTRRIDRIAAPDLLIVDECHHAVASTYVRVIKAWPAARLFGCTATPERLDGRGLGDVFAEMVEGPDTAALVADGFLAPVRYLAPDSRVDLRGVRTTAGDFNVGDLARVMDQIAVTGDAVEHYLQHIAPRTAICFCVTVAHAEHVAMQFRDAGIAAASIDGSMQPDERRAVVEQLRRGDVRVLTSCEVISEGFDAPAVGGCILLRPTQSLALFRQQVGRCLRPKPGGAEAVVLDHVGNVLSHGLPTAPHMWSLDSARRTEADRRKAASKVRRCKACGTVYAAGLRGADCGTDGCIFAPPVVTVAPGALREVAASPSPTEAPRWARVHAMRGGIHEKPGRPPSFRVRYSTEEGWVSEFLALEHEKPGARWYAGKAWTRLSRTPSAPPPTTARDAYQRFIRGELREPQRLRIERDGDWWRVVDSERTAD
jgi:DNA repair protein RadD